MDFLRLHTTAFIPSLIASWAITFGARALAKRLGVIARRNSRRRHEKDTPLLGGTGIYIVLMGLLVWFAYSGYSLRTLGCFAVAITLIYGIGVIDDVRELTAWPKFIAQFTAGALILASEPALPPILSSIGLPDWVAAVILLFWIVGVTNAMNMIDGLDGLCAGTGAISSITLMAVLYSLTGATGANQAFTSIMAAGLAGACLGFLWHNFSPARIFLGDSGSLLIGFVLAAISVKVEIKRSLLVSLSVPIMLLGIPLMDIGLSILRRQRRRRSIFSGDRSHIHHRLQQIGMSPKSAVFLLWGAAAYLGVAAYILAQVEHREMLYIYALFFPSLVFWLGMLWFVERRLSFQTARFSQLFLKQEYGPLDDREALLHYFAKQVAAHEALGTTFCLISIDCQDALMELAHERPQRVVAFYMDLYAIFRSRMRTSDYLGRIGDERFVAILPSAKRGDGIILHLRDRVRELHAAYQVFQGHPDRPEGFRILTYPKDRSKISQILDGARDRSYQAA